MVDDRPRRIGRVRCLRCRVRFASQSTCRNRRGATSPGVLRIAAHRDFDVRRLLDILDHVEERIHRRKFVFSRLDLGAQLVDVALREATEETVKLFRVVVVNARGGLEPVVTYGR